MSSVLLKNGTIITPTGPVEADVVIEGNIIKTILKRPYEPGLISKKSIKFDKEIDVSGKLLFPGLIDCHVHFREPGLEHKETMATGAASALAGGVTTVCEMPNTVPPTVGVGALKDKIKRAGAIQVQDVMVSGANHDVGSHVALRSAQGDMLSCDIRFLFGATEGAHLQELKKLFTDPSLTSLKSRCCGLKLYLDHSTGDQKAPTGVIEEAFKLGAELEIPVVCHCEDADVNEEWRMKNVEYDVAAHSKMRPPESEAKAVEYALSLAKKYGTHLHVAHLSTKGGLDLIRAAKKSGISVTCEVAPHHLFLTVDDYTTLGTLAKMNPPLRTREHQEALWQGIADGTVDCVSTDHAPHTLEEKGVMVSSSNHDPLSAPSGVPGVETMVPLLLSVAAGHWPHPIKKKFQSPISNLHILRLCFTNPNHIFSLGKQGITEGAPADVVIVDPKAEWKIEAKKLHSKCGWTPFEDWKVTGKVVKVLQ